MRFNSVKGGDYSSGARAVNKNADAAFDASRKSSFNFTKTSNAAINARSTERRAAMKAENLKDTTQIKADTLVEGTQIKVDSDKAVADAKRPAKRMAGVVAGLGTIATTGAMMAQDKRDKAEDAKYRAAADQRWASQQEARLELLKSGKNTNTETIEPFVPKPFPEFKPSSRSTDTSSTDEKTTSIPLSGGGKGWSPLSKTIQFSEGTYKKDGTTNYNLGYGGNTFTDLNKHPDTVWHTDSGSSAAAGAYQFMPETYTRASTALGLTDFSPASQEKAGEWLAQKRGVDTSKLYTTRAGLKAAFHQMAPEWAGLPNNDDQSHYKGINGNKSMKFDNLVSFYEKQVGYKLK